MFVNNKKVWECDNVWIVIGQIPNITKHEVLVSWLN